MWKWEGKSVWAGAGRRNPRLASGHGHSADARWAWAPADYFWESQRWRGLQRGGCCCCSRDQEDHDKVMVRMEERDLKDFSIQMELGGVSGPWREACGIWSEQLGFISSRSGLWGTPLGYGGHGPGAVWSDWLSYSREKAGS